MMAAISDLGDLQDIIVQQFQHQVSLINDEYNLKRKGQQDVIAGLQKQRQETQQLFAEHMAGLQAQLALARTYSTTASQLQGTIDSLTTGPGSALSGAERFSLLQSRASALRAELQGASLSARPALMGELSGVLQTMLGVGIFQKPSPQHAELFNNIVAEIEQLRDDAQLEADRAISIERQMLDAELAMQASLREIDNRIAHETHVMEALSAQEQAAIDALRDATVHVIADLKMQQIEIGRIANLKLKEAEQALVKELEELGLPTDMDLATVTVLGDLEKTISSLNGILPTLTTGAGANYTTGTSGMSNYTVNFSGMQVSSAASTGSVEADAQTLGRGIARVILEEYRTGALGREIRADMERH